MSLHTCPIMMTDKEKEFVEKLLIMLRSPAPRNGTTDTIIITRHEAYIAIADTHRRGMIDLKR